MAEFPSSDPYGGAPRKSDRTVRSHEEQTDPHPQYATDTDITALDTRVDALEARPTIYVQDSEPGGAIEGTLWYDTDATC